MSIKRSALAFVAAAMLAAAVPVQAAQADQQVTPTAKQGILLDRIVAVVNDNVILLSELEQQTALTRQEMAGRGTPIPPTDVLQRQVLQQMISTRLQLERAQRQGIRVPDDVVNQALARIAQQNGFSLSDMPNVLASQGVDYNQFRQEIRDQLILHRIHQQAVEKRVVVTPTEVDRYLVAQAKQGHGNTQYHVYQILLRVPHDASPAEVAKIHRKAEAIEKKLRAGTDFQATAAAVSDGRQALKGGDLGWLQGGDLPESLANTVLTMDEGGISQPIRDAEGFHIIKVAGTRAEHKIIVTQTHARHILIKPNLLVSNTEAEQRLEDLRDKIEHGASFTKLAKEYSDDDTSAAQGGDLGWLDPGVVVPQFQQVMDGLKPKQISQPFETPFGWHIVQVLGRRKQNQTDETRRHKAFMAIRERKLREQTERWLQQLRDEAYVSVRLDGPGSTG
ncbi:MAG TPA: peptidylprolyl isomerase [Gammaproteobacteria bacterium]|nr:peptidylprolyl isomerase [Gammaproteobacteria bacterium]